MELAKSLAGMGDRALLIVLVLFAMRYLMKREERRTDEMKELWEKSDNRGIEMAKVATTCAQVLERLERRLK